MQTLMIERMEPGNPDSLYELWEDVKLISNTLTYEQALEMIIKKDDERWEKGA